MTKYQGFDSANNTQTKSIEGGCHCGQVKFVATVAVNSTVLVCNCSMCSMTGFHHLIVPHQQFKLLTGEDHLSEYHFNTRQAKHMFCSKCGVKSFYQPRSHPDCWSINTHCITGFNANDWSHQRFDGENWESAHKLL